MHKSSIFQSKLDELAPFIWALQGTVMFLLRRTLLHNNSHEGPSSSESWLHNLQHVSWSKALWIEKKVKSNSLRDQICWKTPWIVAVSTIPEKNNSRNWSKIVTWTFGFKFKNRKAERIVTSHSAIRSRREEIEQKGFSLKPWHESGANTIQKVIG